jgi:hypothetical protein
MRRSCHGDALTLRNALALTLGQVLFGDRCRSISCALEIIWDTVKSHLAQSVYYRLFEHVGVLLSDAPVYRVLVERHRGATTRRSANLSLFPFSRIQEAAVPASLDFLHLKAVVFVLETYHHHNAAFGYIYNHQSGIQGLQVFCESK